MTSRLTPEQLRSYRWFGPNDLRSFGHRSRVRQMGLAPADWEGKPVIAILNTWSDLVPCHLHFKILVEHVKRGILQAGGMPVELPVLAVSETYMKPTAMLYRNLLAMETEEMLRSQPIDGAVLLGGCDKTTPALIMGATSAALPFIFVPCGPMLRGNWHGQVLGSGSDAWKFWDEKRAGKISEEEWCEIEDGIARSHGHCMTMGTAATMTAIAETLGLTLPGASSIPAADMSHWRMAAESGRQIVENVWRDLQPSALLTPESFRNAIIADMALGGSTNAIIHLIAMAGRAGVPLPLELFDEISRSTPRLADLRPSGRFLMEDFFYAGGLRALLAQISDLLHGDAPTVNGKTLRENLAGAQIHNPDVIRPRDKAISEEGGTAILRGNLAPRGAVIKHAAMEERFMKHTGPAVVFRDYNDLAARIDDPALPVTADSVIVLQNAGPIGAPGMPEWGMLPIPKKLIEQGVRDMLRISDSRMSGTSYGACVLHVAPESAIGGPLALVSDGDSITLDVAARRIDVNIPDSELAARKTAWKAHPPHATRGFTSL
ncbi:MAG: L-arabinonate dehydratase, partial [Chthoniobacteraceae bacterium]